MLPRRLHAACAGLAGVYGGARLALLLLALPYVGARRLEHLQYLVGDPLVRRFAGLARVPTARTVGNWLRRFTQETLRPLVGLNQNLVLASLTRLNLPRLTLDVDGPIVRTGATVAWAFRGFNPHHRKDRSYYPLLAHVAQTGHILRIKNRPGNVHDSKQSAAFLRTLIDAVRDRLSRRVPLVLRMDAAFFQADVLRLLAARGCGYAIKVGRTGRLGPGQPRRSPRAMGHQHPLPWRPCRGQRPVTRARCRNCRAGTAPGADGEDTTVTSWGDWHRTPAAPAAIPTRTFRDSLTLHLNGQRVVVTHIPAAHTDGDAIVWLPDANVIHIGDLFEHQAPPFIDWWAGGRLSGMLAGVDWGLAHSDGGTRIVPGHGPVGTRDDLLRYRELLLGLGTAVAGHVDAGNSVEDTQAAHPAASDLLGRRIFYRSHQGVNIKTSEEDTEFGGNYALIIMTCRDVLAIGEEL